MMQKVLKADSTSLIIALLILDAAILAAGIGVHFVIPLLFIAVPLVLLIAILYPEFGLVSVIFSAFLTNPLFFWLTGEYRAPSWTYLLKIILPLAALLGFYLSGKRFEIRFSSVEFFVFLLLGIYILALLYSPNITGGIGKLAKVVVAVLTGFVLVPFMRADSKSFHRFFSFIVLYGVLMLIYSAFALSTGAFATAGRFYAGIGTIVYPRLLGLVNLVNVFFFSTAKTKGRKIFFLALIAVTLFFEIVAATRGPLVAFAICTIIYILAFWKTKSIYRFSLIVLLVIGLVGLFALAPGMQKTRMTENISIDQSALTRAFLYSLSFRLFLQHPILGVGFNGFSQALPSWAKAVGVVYPHNIFLEHASEMGIVGLLAFVLFLLAVFSRLYSSLWGKDKLSGDLRTCFIWVAIVFLYFLANAQISGSFAGNYAVYLFGIMLSQMI